MIAEDTVLATAILVLAETAPVAQLDCLNAFLIILPVDSGIKESATL
jgi:hypothetical protein